MKTRRTPYTIGSDQHRIITIARVKLGSGYRGFVSLSDSGRKTFSRMGWTRCLTSPESLPADYEKLLKKQGPSCVVLKNLRLCGRQVGVVIKQHRFKLGFREFFRSLRPGKSLRNFKTAVKLIRAGVPTAWPLAAIYKRKFLFTRNDL